MATQQQPTIGEGFLTERKFASALLVDDLLLEYQFLRSGQQKLNSPDLTSLITQCEGFVQIGFGYLVDVLSDYAKSLITDNDLLTRFNTVAEDVLRKQRDYLPSPAAISKLQTSFNNTRDSRSLPTSFTSFWCGS